MMKLRLILEGPRRALVFRLMEINFLQTRLRGRTRTFEKADCLIIQHFY